MELKQPGCETDHLPPTSAKTIKKYSFASMPVIHGELHWQGDNSILLTHCIQFTAPLKHVQFTYSYIQSITTSIKST
jgi:hypothetical protein